MKKSPEIDIAITALTFIKNNGAPVFVNDFINRDLTGDEMADSLLKKIALMMLDFMKKDGMIEADDLTSPDAKIYGLTVYGTQVYDTFSLLIQS